jgi:hypothetical protein
MTESTLRHELAFLGISIEQMDYLIEWLKLHRDEIPEEGE